MAALTTIGIISLILAATSTGVQMYQQHKAGEAAKASGEKQQEVAQSQAGLADYNAAVVDLQKTDAVERGAEEESRYRMQIRSAIGAQRAGIAANNIDVGFGSALDVQADAAFLGELDALTIRTNAAREAWGFQVQAEDLRKRAEIARKEGVYLEAAGREQQRASNVAMWGTLLGGGASLFQMSYGFGRSNQTTLPRAAPYSTVPGGFATIATGF